MTISSSPKIANFFVIGAAKSGTTSIYNWLSQHPDIYMSPVKEPNFFSDDIDASKFRKSFKAALKNQYRHYLKKGCANSLFIRDYGEYVALFKGTKNEKALGEASNSYLYSASAACNIKARIPDAKILVCLRNPADRLLSHYHMEVKAGVTDLPFREAVEKDINLNKKGWGLSSMYIELGLYYEQLKRYLDVFPREKIMIFKYEELDRPEMLLPQIFSFLEVDPAFQVNTKERANVSAEPRLIHLNHLLYKTRLHQFLSEITPDLIKPYLMGLYFSDNNNKLRMSNEFKKYAMGFYREDLKRLSELIELDISDWMVK